MKNELVLDALEVQELSFNEVNQTDGGNIYVRAALAAWALAAATWDAIDGIKKGWNDACAEQSK